MSELKSVLLAIDVATQKRDQAIGRLVQAQRACQAAQDQLDQLSSYATDTEAKWSAAVRVSVSPELMRHHYQFMDRLRHAIGMQDAAVGELQLKTEEARRKTMQAEGRLAGLQKVLKNKQAQHAARTSRREQRQMDEFAALQYGRLHVRYPNGETP
jgi:flagellar FliJ protein